MKSSEKIQLLMKGVKMDEIKALEEQEAAEAEEAKKAAEMAEEAKAEEEAKKAEEEKPALQAALDMVKDLESKLSAKEDELTKLNQQFADLNNKQTLLDQPEKRPNGADVMAQLFKKSKEEK